MQLLDLVEALDLFRTDIEETNSRLAYLEERARHSGAHHSIIHELTRIGADCGAHVQTTLSPRKVGHIAAIAGRSTSDSMRRQNFDMAISAPVFPAETQTSASPVFTASIACHMDDLPRPERSA